MRFWIAVGLILAAEIFMRIVDRSTTPAIANPTARPLSDVSLSLPGWSGEEVELDPRIFVKSGAFDSANRVYRNSAGDPVSIFIGSWLDYQTAAPHSPEECYPSGGWEIISRRPLTVSTKGGEQIIGRLLTLDKQGQRLAVLFWYYLGSEVVVESDDVRRALQSLRGRGTSRPPLIKVMFQTSLDDPVRAEHRLVELAAVIASEMQAIVR